MLITRQSQLTGVTRQKEIDVTDEQLNKWKNGTLIQNAMPHLSADDREFIMTGVTAEEWNEFVPKDEVNDND